MVTVHLNFTGEQYNYLADSPQHYTMRALNKVYANNPEKRKTLATKIFNQMNLTCWQDGSFATISLEDEEYAELQNPGSPIKFGEWVDKATRTIKGKWLYPQFN